MNKIRNQEYTNSFTEYSIKELTGKNLKDDQTAFWGYMEGYEENGICLYLIHYSGIMQADNPGYTWNSDCGGVAKVICFVDIEIIPSKGVEE